MNNAEQSGHFVFDESPSAPTKTQPTTVSIRNESIHGSDEDHYWAHIFKDHYNSFFCPNCGEIYENSGYCFEHGDAHPTRLESLILENCKQYFSVIKAKNPTQSAQ